MFRSLRIFFDRRFFAAAIYVALAVILSILLEPRPRFHLSDEERQSSISFTPDGRWFITAVHQTTIKNDVSITTSSVRLRDLATGDTIRELGSIGGPTPKLSVSPDSTLVAASNDEEIIVWQTADSRVCCQQKTPGPVQVIRFKPSLRAICRALDPKSEQLDIIDPMDGSVVATIGPVDDRTDRTRSPFISCDQTKLVTFGYARRQGAIRIWNLEDGKLVCERTVPGAASIALLCFGPKDESFIWGRFGKGTAGEPTVTQLYQSMFKDPNADRTTTIASKPTRTNPRWPWWFDRTHVQCAITPDEKLFVIGSSDQSAIIDFDVFQLKELVHNSLLSPSGDYLCCNVDSGVPGLQIVIQALPSQQVVFSRLSNDGEGVYNEISGWSSDGRYLVLRQTNHGGTFRRLKTLLQRIKITLDFDNSTTHEIQLVNPRSGKVDSSIKCEDPKSLHFAPDGQACILDGYVYDVPFRKPWWAILGLPAVLALVVWRPYGKKQTVTTKDTKTKLNRVEFISCLSCFSW